MILFFISFLAGILTVFAPCILPLLPVIVGSSVEEGENKKKALVISASLGLSVIIFTLLLKSSTLFINISGETWGYISGGIIVLFGLISIFPSMWESIPLVSSLSISSNKVLGIGYNKKNFLGEIIIGASLGPVFSTCSPTYFVVLATVLPKSFSAGIIDLLAYAFGLSGTLLLISYLGQKVVARFGWVSDTRGIFRRILGLIFVILGFFIVFGIDKKIERKILDAGFFDITRVEQKILELRDEKQIPKLLTELNAQDVKNDQGKNIQKSHGPKAPEIVNSSGFINTDGKPITIGEFKGKKVVLLDVWTYSCINCQRTLPYVKAWYEKYKDKGLIVVGLHTPEFSFEKVQSNVEDAVKRFGITYPVVMDNNYSTWTAYGNQYWPRKYLISIDGEIIYDHIGEGNYDETEKAIQRALYEANGNNNFDGESNPKGVISFEPEKVKSPETYFGSNRNEYLGNGNRGALGVQSLTIPIEIYPNTLYLGGVWNFYPEYVTSLSSGKVAFKYNSKDVYVVASSDQGVDVDIYIDGKKLKTVSIKDNKLYTLISGTEYLEHLLEIVVPKGLNIFTFTFG